MIIDRNKLCYHIMVVIGLLTLLFINVNCDHLTITGTNISNNDHNSGQHEARSHYSPRMDYNEWMPIGRGDPLKNDPTYDYSPPTLDRVRYWGDSNKDKKEILLLGVPSKRQSHKKEANQNTNTNNNNTYAVRRNYYPSHTSLHQLPTRLMPPPVQTISPTTKQSSTENYYSLYNQSPNSNFNNYQSHNNWNINSLHYDTHPDESINYVSLTRPEGPSNPKPSLSNYGQYYTTSSSRKPWIYELLQKEITKPSSHSPQMSFVPSSSSSLSSSLSPQISSSTNFLISPSKNIYESHSSIEPVTFNYVTPSLSTTITTEESEPTYFQPTIPPTPASTPIISIDSLASASYQKNKQHHEINSIHGPMYIIIQGHSKVKTYGLKDNDTNDHQPKIVPITPKEEAVTKRVVPKDDNGKIIEVKHLHKKVTESVKEKSKISTFPITTTKTTTPTPTTITTTSTSTEIPKLISNSTATLASTTEESSPMKSLLSLLDSSLGNFFLNDFEDENLKDTNNNKTNKIKSTTIKPSTSAGSFHKNCTTSSDINEIRERRQTEAINYEYENLSGSRFDEYFDDENLSDFLFDESKNTTTQQIKSELNSTAAI